MIYHPRQTVYDEVEKDCANKNRLCFDLNYHAIEERFSNGFLHIEETIVCSFCTKSISIRFRTKKRHLIYTWPWSPIRIDNHQILVNTERYIVDLNCFLKHKIVDLIPFDAIIQQKYIEQMKKDNQIEHNHIITYSIYVW